MCAHRKSPLGRATESAPLPSTKQTIDSQNMCKVACRVSAGKEAGKESRGPLVFKGSIFEIPPGHFISIPLGAGFPLCTWKPIMTRVQQHDEERNKGCWNLTRVENRFDRLNHDLGPRTHQNPSSGGECEILFLFICPSRYPASTCWCSKRRHDSTGRKMPSLSVLNL